MPEPPNKIAWQQSREECAQQLIEAINDPQKVAQPSHRIF
jgi:hypothetical protein